MMYKEKSPSNIQEGVWDEKSCVRRQCGFVVNQDKLPKDLKWLPKGTPLAYDEATDKVKVCKTAKVYENATKSAVSVKVYKGHLLQVNDTIGGSTISAVDTSNANFDTLTVSALAEKVDKDTVLDDGNAAKVVGLNYATIELDGQQSCTPTLQAYEIEEGTLPYPLNDTIKTALTCRHAFKL